MLPSRVNDADRVLDLVDGLLLTGGADFDPARYGDASMHPSTYGIDQRRDEFEITLIHGAIERDIPAAQQQAIAATFWRVGRLTLEPWLAPRLDPDVVTPHPNTEVTEVRADGPGVKLTLSDATVLAADHVIFATGYRTDLARVPYLSGVVDQLSITDGYPDLSEGFETSLNGLYITGFASTRDFGPFYGFTAGCASAARITVTEMMT